MATYREIQDWVKRRYGYTVKTCWIAHIKELNGLKPRVAPNRHAQGSRLVPCPARFRPMIEEAMRHFGMLP